MKYLLLASALVIGSSFTATAQTPVGTPPSGTVPPSGSTAAPKPDATIETQSTSVDANNANPADRTSNQKKSMGSKRKGGKMKLKSQHSSTM